jgi:hypothetical protein
MVGMMRLRAKVLVAVVLWGLITHGTHAGTGDEPHYLAITHSIAFDGDLDLSNNYGANEPLVGGGVLMPGAHLRPGVDGTMRPVHDVGMPALFVPVARVAVPLTNFLARVLPESALQRMRLNPAVLYRHLLSLAMIALATVLAGLLFDALVAMGASAMTAFAASVLLMLSPPLMIFSILFFTELLSALVCFAVFYRIVIADVRGTARWWWLGCLTGLLFLIHARNIGLMAPLAALALYHLRDRPRRGEAMAFAGGAALFIAVRTLVNYRFWGELVSGPHAHAAEWSGAKPLLAEAATRLLGLLVDQEYGLLPYAPVYVLAAAGAFTLAKTNRALTLALTVVVASYVALIVCPLTNVHGWTGGWSPSARFLTPIAPLLGLWVFAGLRATPRFVSVAIVAIQIVISAYVWQHPKVLWNDGDGRAAICAAFPAAACAWLPSFTGSTNVSPESNP